MNDREFSKYTEKIRTMLPFWFKMKKKPKDSLGIDFLKAFGMQLDDIDKMLDYAYKQTKIETVDVNYVDILYKIDLPTYFNIDSIVSIKSSKSLLIETTSLYTLFNLAENIGIYENINQPNYYFIDKENKIIYVTECYDKTSIDQFGRLSILVSEDNEEKYISFPLELHNIWNFFDEFGALLNCPRLFGEKNLSYKRRILDVFKNPASSTRFGLLNGVARELNLRKYITWEDTSKDLILKDRMIILDTIKINDKYLDINKVYLTTEGYILIKKDLSYGKNAEVSFVSDIDMFSIIDHNREVDNLLFNADGSLNTAMIKYKEDIRNKSSILFKDFKYGNAVFIDDNDNITAEHFLFDPYKTDANIKGFRKFKLCGSGCI